MSSSPELYAAIDRQGGLDEAAADSSHPVV